MTKPVGKHASRIRGRVAAKPGTSSPHSPTPQGCPEAAASAPSYANAPDQLWPILGLDSPTTVSRLYLSSVHLSGGSYLQGMERLRACLLTRSLSDLCVERGVVCPWGHTGPYLTRRELGEERWRALESWARSAAREHGRFQYQNDNGVTDPVWSGLPPAMEATPSDEQRTQVLRAMGSAMDAAQEASPETVGPVVSMLRDRFWASAEEGKEEEKKKPATTLAPCEPSSSRRRFFRN